MPMQSPNVAEEGSVAKGGEEDGGQGCRTPGP